MAKQEQENTRSWTMVSMERRPETEVIVGHACIWFRSIITMFSLEVTVFRQIAMVLLLQPAVMSGQNDPIESISSGSTAYVGILGNGWLYSVNYDRSWRMKEMGLSMSMGCAYLPDFTRGPRAARFSLPVQINIFHGHNSSMEHGAGLTYGSGWNAINAQGGSRSEALHLFIKPTGYRYQRKTGGLFIRAYTLVAIKLVEFNDAWALYEKGGGGPEPNGVWFGVDLGYTFKRK